MSPPVPPWLQKAYTEDHITNVWRILSDRECSRICARSLSLAASRCHPEPDHRRSPIAPLPTQLSSDAHPGVTRNLADHYSIALGCSSENVHRNRYSDIQPYDRTRVAVGGRYFNANWVREHAGGRWTISTQAPLPSTTHEFLSIIAGISPVIPPRELGSQFTRVRTVVQLTPYFESGRQKAHPYFPFEPGESKVVHPSEELSELPPLKLTLVKVEIIESAKCAVCTVAIAPISGEGPTNPAVVFRHLLYGAWPDNGVPEPGDQASLLNFIKLVDRTNKDLSGLEATADVEPPIMVHCSAGVGRTGSFIALCSLLRSNGLLSKPNPHTAERAVVHPPLPQSPLGPLPESISWDEVIQEVDSLREQRPGMVQRPEQVLIIYEILIGAFIYQGRCRSQTRRSTS
ncbi:phosphatases II [Lactarius psammicola]|nr:phosphatases II [Lactarius psammicola]